jgi:2,3,4,5-tetrahydropyridine-2-carboxylate N-succinyltransferase
VHLSAGVQVGGVLEPAGARPVIVEDEALIGGQCGLYEGVRIGRRAVLGAGVVLTASTRVFDLVHERELRGSAEEPLEIPAEAVLVPGSRALAGRFAHQHGLGLACSLIVKYRDARTDARTALEEALRACP